MYKVLSKDTIELEIVPSIPVGKRGFKSKVPICEIINCILYKLKTGIQWYLLPIFQLFSKEVLHYKTVFGYYRKWCKAGVWKSCWSLILQKNKSKIDLSSADVDGSHTTALRGGEAVGYQRRKKRKTTNAIYLTDRSGLPLAMSIPVCGNHNDLFNIEKHFEQITDFLQQSGITLDGLFLNFDAGFDAENLRSQALKLGIMPILLIIKETQAHIMIITLIINYIKKDSQSKEQMPGWIVSDLYSIVLIPQLQVG